MEYFECVKGFIVSVQPKLTVFLFLNIFSRERNIVNIVVAETESLLIFLLAFLVDTQLKLMSKAVIRP